MRQIKFRAWDGKKIVHAGYIGSSGTYYHSCGPSLKDMSDEGYVLMQFTGLLDKNGREIFEGDLVSYLEGQDCWYEKIVYAPEMAAFAFEDADGNRSFINPKKELSVVGNEFENPELLNQNA